MGLAFAAVIVLGLTGGIGAGKSTVASLLGRRGAAVVDVDAIGREVIAAGSDGAAEVQARFGTIVRAELAAIVFRDEDARHDLEAISWPRIEDELRRLVTAATADVVVLDMAVLAQGLAHGIYGPVATVEASDEVRLARLVQRGMTEEDARARMAAQTPESVRRSLADVVIVNDAGLAELETETDRLWRRLQSSS
jgi:dephospho-CoA kinase